LAVIDVSTDSNNKELGMQIRVNGAELEMFRSCDVYVGCPGRGQIFKKWSELDKGAVHALEDIQLQAEKLIRRTEQILSGGKI
jgi:hypothetical protein